MGYSRPMRSCLLLLVLLPALALAAPVRETTLSLTGGEEWNFEVYAQPDAPVRVLWIAAAFGLHAAHRQAAAALANRGMEVWLIDLAEAQFLPPGVGSLRRVPAAPIGEAIHRLARDRDLVVVSNGYGAVPVLRGIRAWQGRPDNRADRLLGAILFSPNLFARIPRLGEPPVFLPVTDATSVPLFVFQAGRNGNRWHLPALLERLQRHAPVYVQHLPGVTSLFYDGDTSAETRMARPALPARFEQAIERLRAHPVPKTALPLPGQPVQATAQDSGLDDRLRPYRGRVRPTPFTLPDLTGRAWTLDDFRGRVTVLNFWATWCPPCVEEIPSLNRLRQAFAGHPFRLISVNYAEPPEQVRAFLEKVQVDFPVLLDTDGRTSARWQVVAFPSTFVIGPDGTIRYGVNAAIAWDDPDVIRALEALLPAKGDQGRADPAESGTQR